MAKHIKKTLEEKDDLKAFAIRVEKQILAAGIKGQETIERLVCRSLTNRKNPAVAAIMAHKWVEWRYGKATEHVKIDAHIEHEHIDTERLTDSQLAEAEALIESAVSRSDP
jgi:hypothetical protein